MSESEEETPELSELKEPQGADWRPLLVVAGAFVLALLSLAAVKSYRDLEGARNREQGLEKSIKEAGQRIERLHGQIERLRSDPATLERLAREDLGLVRPGDVVLVLPPPETAAKPKPASDVTQSFQR